MSYPNSILTPEPILQTAFGFWSSKVLLTAVEFGVFTRLGDGRMTGAELGQELGLHPRAISDFFDALVAMKFLEREGDGPDAKYSNTPAGTLYLNQKSPRYVGGILVMLNARLFKFWNDLPEALRTGKPQNEMKHTGKSMFEGVYAAHYNRKHIAHALPGAWSAYRGEVEDWKVRWRPHVEGRAEVVISPDGFAHDLWQRAWPWLLRRMSGAFDVTTGERATFERLVYRRADAHIEDRGLMAAARIMEHGPLPLAVLGWAIRFPCLGGALQRLSGLVIHVYRRQRGI